jgi:hypothetical protein
MSGSKIVESLKQAIAGDFARVTIEGQLWAREVTEPDTVRSAKWRNCHHPDLQFGSGGHFIFCCKCGAEWVASFDGGNIDYQRANNIVTGFDHRKEPQ